MNYQLDKTLFIEHCTNCKSHKWCTYHIETKYHDFFNKIKAVVSSEYPDFTIVENEPLINNSFVFKKDDSFPRLGSFEITYKNKKIFSKLALGIWPNSLRIVSKIKDVLAGNEVTDYNFYKPPNKNNETLNEEESSTFKRAPKFDKGNQVKTDSFRHEKNKFSSSVPKENRANANFKVNRDRSPDQVYIEKPEKLKIITKSPEKKIEKKPEKEREKTEKKEKAIKTEKNEKTHIPPNFVQKEVKEKKEVKPKKIEKAEILAVLSNEKGKEKINFKVNDVPSIEKIEKPPTKKKSEIIHKQASNKEKNKVKDEVHEEEDKYEEKFEENNDNDENQNNEDYNDYANEEFESPKEQPIQFYEGDDEKNKEEITKNLPAQEDEYKEDFEEPVHVEEEVEKPTKPKKKSTSKPTSKKNIPEEKIPSKKKIDDNEIKKLSVSQKKITENNDNIDKKAEKIPSKKKLEEPKNDDETKKVEEEDPSKVQRPETQGNHGQGQGKRSKPNLTNPETKTSTKEEIDAENEKYKQFVAKLEKVEYIEEKASSFNIKLNQDIKKRITLANDDAEEVAYKIFSSQPKGLEISTPDLVIPKNDKGKIGLIFKSHDTEEKIAFTLYIFKNKQPYEKIVLTANYMINV